MFKIPPRASNEGYRCSDWEQFFIWKGRLRVVAKGDELKIRLEDIATNDLFAECKVTEGAVESVIDSSRYFVLRIDDGSGRHAFIGIGFQERNEAFDLNVTIQDHNKRLRAEKEAKAATEKAANTPALDLGFKEGQKITVKLGKATGAKPKAKTGGAVPTLLPPPPGGSGAPRRRLASPAASNAASTTVSSPTTTTTTSANTAAPSFAAFGAPAPAANTATTDAFAGLSLGNPTATPAAAAPAATSNPMSGSKDLFGDFADLGNLSSSKPAAAAPANGAGTGTANNSDPWAQFM